MISIALKSYIWEVIKTVESSHTAVQVLMSAVVRQGKKHQNRKEQGRI